MMWSGQIDGSGGKNTCHVSIHTWVHPHLKIKVEPGLSFGLVGSQPSWRGGVAGWDRWYEFRIQYEVPVSGVRLKVLGEGPGLLTWPSNDTPRVHNINHIAHSRDRWDGSVGKVLATHLMTWVPAPGHMWWIKRTNSGRFSSHIYTEVVMHVFSPTHLWPHPQRH